MASFVLAAAVAAALGEAPARRPVLVVTDCGVGIDDEWALAHLAVSPAFDLRGIIATHAPNLRPPAAETAAQAARAWLDRLPLTTRPPVVAGSSRPLEDGAVAGPGVALLLEQARGYTAERRLDVIVIGAATDLALALRVDPTLADRIAIVAMGFSRWPEGGDPWNVKNDPRAWQVLLESRAPITVGDDAVCRRDLRMTPTRARRLFGDRGALLSALLDDWLARNGKLALTLTGVPDAVPIWDEVTVAFLLGLTRQESRPRPRLRDDLTFDHSRPRGTITWVTAIDADRLWADLAANLAR
jgi:inosine-uridine nucleoside N-ribohydrolase